MEEQKEAIKENSTDLIDKANAAAERLEKANLQQAELIKQQTEIIARQALGGRSAAGIEIKPKTADDEYQEAANKYLKLMK